MTTEKQLSAKQLAIQAIGTLPDDATVDDAVDCVVMAYKFEAGLKEAHAGELIPHEEVKKQFEQWLQ